MDEICHTIYYFILIFYRQYIRDTDTLEIVIRSFVKMKLILSLSSLTHCYVIKNNGMPLYLIYIKSL